MYKLYFLDNNSDDSLVQGEMLGNKLSSYPQRARARDALDCHIEAFLHNWRVIAKRKLCSLLAKVPFPTDRSIPE